MSEGVGVSIEATVGDGRSAALPRAIGSRTGIRAMVGRQAPWVLVAGDLAACAAAFALALEMLIGFGTVAVPDLHGAMEAGSPLHVLGTGTVFVGIIAALHLQGHYTGRIPFWSGTLQIVITVMSAMFALMIVEVAMGGTPAPAWLALLWLFTAPLIVASHAVTRTLLLRAGCWSVRTLVLGSAQAAEDVGAVLASERLLGYDVIGSIDPAELVADGFLAGLASAIRLHRPGFIVATLGSDSQRERDLLLALDRTRIPYAVVPHALALPVHGITTQHFFGYDLMLLMPRNNFARPVSLGIKRGLDIAIAGSLLAFTAPVFLAVALLIRLDGGPAMFSHRRVGAAGRRFGCLKFRTMVTDADVVLSRLLSSDPAASAEWAETQKLTDDPRITPVGRFLRQTSLDEIPQLLNVLRGEMSLVGPRPIVEAEILRYGEQISYYLEARPGLTGLWQVSGRSETTYAKRVRLDVWYVRNWSLWHDFAIMLKTIPAVLLRRGSV